MPGARACLERLRGGWRLAVVTNSTRAEAATVLGPLGHARRLLDAVIAREDYAAAKPRPTPTSPRRRRSAARPRACVAVEDTPRGVRAGAGGGHAR